MKVALLICGQPRAALQTCMAIKSNIIDCNDTDVFMHMWYDPNNLYMEKGEKDRSETLLQKGLDRVLLDFYKPKAYCIEKQKFANFNNYDRNYFDAPERYVSNMNKCGKNQELTYDETKLRLIKYTHLSQFYSFFRCNMLKEEYSLENNVYYDMVLRIRYDLVVPSPIVVRSEFAQYNGLYYEEMGQPDDIISDWINMGSNEVMNVYSSVFLYMKYLNNCQGHYSSAQRPKTELYQNGKCILGPEYLIRDLMFKLGIPKCAMRIGVSLHYDS